MAKKETTTILERLQREGFPIEVIEKDAGNKYTQYIAELILSSDKVAERSKLPWEYKSLREFGEEYFVLRDNAHWSFDYSGSSKKPDINGWQKGAIEQLNNYIWWHVTYEEDGLQLYVRSPDGSYREAREGDRQYDLVHHIAEESGLDKLEYYAPPGWWNDLYFGHANYEAYDLVFSMPGDTRDPRYPWFKKEKVAIVRRETERRFSIPVQSVAVREPFNSITDQAPDLSRSDAPRAKGRLMELATEVQARFWGENFVHDDRSTWSSQDAIISWIKEQQPGISDANAKAVEKVACPVERGIRAESL